MGKGGDGGKGSGAPSEASPIDEPKSKQRLKRMTTEEAEPKEENKRPPAIKIKKSPSVLEMEASQAIEDGVVEPAASETVEKIAKKKKRKSAQKEADIEKPIEVSAKAMLKKSDAAKAADAEHKGKKQKHAVEAAEHPGMKQKRKKTPVPEAEEEGAEEAVDTEEAWAEEAEEDQVDPGTDGGDQDAELEGQRAAKAPAKKMVSVVEDAPSLVRLRTKTSVESLPSPVTPTPPPKKVHFSPSAVKKVSFSPDEPPSEVSSKFLGFDSSFLFALNVMRCLK